MPSSIRAAPRTCAKAARRTAGASPPRCHRRRRSGCGARSRSRGSGGRAPALHYVARRRRRAPSTRRNHWRGRPASGHRRGGSTGTTGSGCGVARPRESGQRARGNGGSGSHRCGCGIAASAAGRDRSWTRVNLPFADGSRGGSVPLIWKRASSRVMAVGRILFLPFGCILLDVVCVDAAARTGARHSLARCGGQPATR